MRFSFLDEDFAIESLAGDIFMLGTTSWRVRQVRGGEAVGRQGQGAFCYRPIRNEVGLLQAALLPHRIAEVPRHAGIQT